jgi:cobalt/nickel transport system permease protein
LSFSGTAFSSGASPLHRADARAKIFSACILSFTTAMAQSTFGAGIALGAGFILVRIAGLSLPLVLRRALPANLFFSFLFVSLALTYPGEAWPMWHMVSLDGVDKAVLIIMKGNAVLLIVFSLMATSTMSELVRGMQALGLHHKLVLLLAFVHRQSVLSAREMERMLKAATQRCFEPKPDARTLRTYASMVGIAILRSIDRAQRIQNAMIMRGFEGRFYSLEETTPYTLVDRCILAACATAAIIIFLADSGSLS